MKLVRCVCAPTVITRDDAARLALGMLPHWLAEEQLVDAYDDPSQLNDMLPSQDNIDVQDVAGMGFCFLLAGPWSWLALSLGRFGNQTFTRHEQDQESCCRDVGSS